MILLLCSQCERCASSCHTIAGFWLIARISLDQNAGKFGILTWRSACKLSELGDKVFRINWDFFFFFFFNVRRCRFKKKINKSFSPLIRQVNQSWNMRPITYRAHWSRSTWIGASQSSVDESEASSPPCWTIQLLYCRLLGKKERVDLDLFVGIILSCCAAWACSHRGCPVERQKRFTFHREVFCSQ